MLRKFLKLQLVSPVNVGLGGPFCSLLSTLSGIHKVLPFWALCPLWGLILVPLTCLFPSILPIYLLFALKKGYQQRGIPNYYDPYDSNALSAAQSPQDINQNTLWQDHAFAPSKLHTSSVEDTLQDKSNNSAKLDTQSKAHAYNNTENQAEAQAYTLADEQTDAHRILKQQSQDFARASQAQDHSDYIDGYLVKPCSVRQNIDNFIRINIFSNLMQNKYLIAMAQFIYWIVLAFTVYGINLLSNLTSERYISSSMQRQVLYTTSQESIDYTNTLITIFTAGGFVVLIAMLFAFVMSLVAAADCLYPKKVAALVILKNLPGFFVLSCLMYAAIMLTERTYAHYVLAAYKDIIMGNDYFNPAWLFMVLRIYIIHAFLSCFVLSMMMSLRILPGTFIIRPKQNDTSGSITQSAAYSQEIARSEFKSWRQAEEQRQMSDAAQASNGTYSASAHSRVTNDTNETDGLNSTTDSKAESDAYKKHRNE